MKTYCIRQQVTNYLKIGKSENPQRRLKELQTGSPTTLTLLHSIEGDFESELHQKFREFNLNGEWFEWHDDIIFRFKCLENEIKFNKMASPIREAWGLTEPEYGCLPSWFERAVEVYAEQFGAKSYLEGLGHINCLRHVLSDSLRSNFLDHWGRVNDNFICEPYGPFGYHLSASTQLAEELKCKVHHRPFSWHYPGRTYRITFYRGKSSDG